MIPLRTDTPIRRTPVANYVLLASNALAFAVTDLLAPEALLGFKHHIMALSAALPSWWQFFTYQFTHGDAWHLLGNMIFLWVFGNSVNDKMGNWPYLLFYLGGGVFAGWGFALGSDHTLMGASGSIAAVTMAFLVLFPRGRILFLFWFFIITTFELPAFWVILLKIVLWDNILAPGLEQGAGAVAYSAHLFGYLYGFLSIMAMLLFGALSRDQFDFLALLRRWNQRRVYNSMMRNPDAAARARYGTVARPITLNPQRQVELQAQLDQQAELRSQIADALGSKGQDQAAMDYYEQWMVLDPEQCLARQQQMELARLFYQHQKFPQAVAAFEKYVKHYPKGPEQDEVHLLLGIIYARDLGQYEPAESHLAKALDRLTDSPRRQQAQKWLEVVQSSLHSGPAEAG